MDRRLCSICGSLNPLGFKYCLTCEADLPQTPATLVNISQLLRNSQKMPLSYGLSATSKCSPVANCRICSRENVLGVRFCDWCGIYNPTGKESLNQGVVSDYGCPSCYCQSPEGSKFCFQCGLELTTVGVKNGFGDHCLRESGRMFTRVICDAWKYLLPSIDISAGIFEKERRSMISPTLRENRKTVSTQTMRPFHPSCANSKPPGYPELSARERLPIVTPISPGKG